MSKYWWSGIVLLLAFGVAWGEGEPWRELYKDEQAGGATVLGLWQFQRGAESADSSSQGHQLTLRGLSRFVDDGPFNGCLESFQPPADADEAQGAEIKTSPSLSPRGAFTLELWLKPKPEFASDRYSYLIDKQYHRNVADGRGNKDYQLIARALDEGKHMLEVYLGHGDDSSYYSSQAISLPTDEWAYLAFYYDGAGTGRFYLNGQGVGEKSNPGRGAIAPGTYSLTIGARVGSSNAGAAAFFSQVRLSDNAPAWLAPQPTAALSGGRRVFLRFEPQGQVSVAIKNPLSEPLQGLQATINVPGANLPAQRTAVRTVPANGQLRAELPVNLSLKPGQYDLSIGFSGQAGGQAVNFATEGQLTIMPRPLPQVFPVVDWGIPETAYKVTDYESLHEIGFTHSLFRETDVANFERVWQAGKPLVPVMTPDQTLQQLDTQLAAGLRHVVQLNPGQWVISDKGDDHEARQKQYLRVNRSGESSGRKNVCGLFPAVQQYAFNIGASAGQTFGQHPALDGSMIHSEIRDGSTLCFHPHDRAAYRQASGREIPAGAVSRDGVGSSARRQHVSARGLIDDDNPLLDYYRWFWREGDGWNELHSQTHRGLKTGTHDNFWTFNDPAVRCPPLWGSGGECDVISQWTYTYPDPPRIGLATDELFAMAAGRPGQKVMKMTQIIWYREQTAPNLPENEADRAEWEKTEPEAKFLTIAPDHLREAFWLKLSRPVQGIMYHGDQSLGMGPRDNPSAYRYTNPETRRVLSELIHQYAQSLGPTLMQVPDPAPEIAMLESFSSMIFGAAQTWGWGNGWVADMHLILQWARLQPQIVYEETILRDRLEGIKVLVMPYCQVLPQQVYEQIAAFQRRGGIVVGDQYLAPAVTPDIIVRQPAAGGAPDQYKATLQALAAQLRTELDPGYQARLDSSDPDVLVRRRQYREAEYVFAINDKRTYGNYVGHHHLVMEQGVPHQATLSLSRPGAQVYDLCRQQSVATRATPTGLQWTADLGPGEGRVYLVTPAAVSEVRVAVANRQPAETVAQIQVQVVDNQSEPLAALIPVQVKVLDPAGELAEHSGHYGAKDGVLSLKLDLAPNDTPGEWTIEVRELASGKTAQAKLTYQP
jgi:hypothetical protein